MKNEKLNFIVSNLKYNTTAGDKKQYAVMVNTKTNYEK